MLNKRLAVARTAHTVPTAAHRPANSNSNDNNNNNNMRGTTPQ